MLHIPKLVLFLLFTSQIHAQILENHFYGNTVGADLLPGHLKALDDGGAVITGSTNTLDTGGFHVLLIRTDSLGNVLWQRSYHQGKGVWLAKATDGGFIVGGSSKRHLFGPDQGFIMKVNKSGVEEWKQYLPVGDHSSVSNIVPLPSGDIAVCGVVTNEGTYARQKVFWSIFDAYGNLVIYKTIDNFESSYLPKIIKAKNDNLIIAWSTVGDDMVRCFTPFGQTIWEHNLTEEFDCEIGHYKTLLIDSIGNLWMAGAYKSGLITGYKPKVLCFASNGNLKHEIDHAKYIYGPIELASAQNGSVNLWFQTSFENYTTGFIKLKLSEQGVILSRDSITVNAYSGFQSIDEVNENRILLLEHAVFPTTESTNIQIQSIQKTISGYQVLDQWKLSSGLPFSHEYYAEHCSSLAEGQFILTWGASKSNDPHYLGLYVLKVDKDSRETAWTYLGVDSGGICQILGTIEGGAIALNGQGQAYKLDANANLLWSKQTKKGRLFIDSDNGFFIVQPHYQQGKHEPILIHQYDQNGDSIAVKKVYSYGQDYYLTGGISQINHGMVLFGNKFDESGNTWRNWIIYLDKEGDLLNETLLSSTYSPTSYSSKIIRTSDGGALIASYISNFTSQGIHLMQIKDGMVTWEYNLPGSDYDSIQMELLSIEELPCNGFVVAFSVIPRYPHSASNEIIQLHHINENGQGRDFFSYKPLLGHFSPDPDFLPGYTFRSWGHQMNGQTFDVLLQTVQFQDTNSVKHPIDKLVIMPNPSGDEICLHHESVSYGLLEVEIYNEAGRMVDYFKSQKNEPDWKLDYRGNFPAGVYVIRIKIGQKDWVTQQWIKVR